MLEEVRFAGPRPGGGGRAVAVSLAVAALMVSGVAAPRMWASSSAPAGTSALVTEGLAFTADDGITLHASIGGTGGIERRPLIIEDSPYAPSCCDTFAGPAYNYIELQWRGTGLSGGSFSTTGSRDQKDLSEFVGWACRQPWSNGSIGLYGFSASAIAVYNAMHLPLPCVKAAALMAGTVDLYRDLLYIGGVNNAGPGAYVEGAVAAPWLGDLPIRVQQQPGSIPDSARGYVGAPLDVHNHRDEDPYWLDRTFRSDPNHIPILADTGFYDVESRGPFLTYRATRSDGSHLLVIGAHDGFAGNTAGPFPEYARWFDHYVRGIDTGIDREPPVGLYLSDGSHEQLIDGHDTTHLTGSDWPLPQTQWTRLYFSPARSGTTRSLNDGSLSTRPVARPAVQRYPFAPSDSLATDPHTVSAVSGAGFGGLSINRGADALPALTDMQAAEPTALTYTTPVLTTAVDAVGPASLDVFAASTAPVTDLVAVLADVWPDGTAHPVATGQLRTAFPGVDLTRSLLDPRTGDVVEPYTNYATENPAPLGGTREYHLEILPIGNHFAAGHRLRLYVVGTSLTMNGAPPGVDALSIGGVTPSRLLLASLQPLPFA